MKGVSFQLFHISIFQYFYIQLLCYEFQRYFFQVQIQLNCDNGNKLGKEWCGRRVRDRNKPL